MGLTLSLPALSPPTTTTLLPPPPLLVSPVITPPPPPSTPGGPLVELRFVLGGVSNDNAVVTTTSKAASDKSFFTIPLVCSPPLLLLFSSSAAITTEVALDERSVLDRENAKTLSSSLVSIPSAETASITPFPSESNTEFDGYNTSLLAIAAVAAAVVVIGSSPTIGSPTINGRGSNDPNDDTPSSLFPNGKNSLLLPS